MVSMLFVVRQSWAENWSEKLLSPNEVHQLNIVRDDSREIKYKVECKGKNLVESSRVAISLDNHLPNGRWLSGKNLKDRGWKDWC